MWRTEPGEVARGKPERDYAYLPSAGLKREPPGGVTYELPLSRVTMNMRIVCTS